MLRQFFGKLRRHLDFHPSRKKKDWQIIGLGEFFVLLECKFPLSPHGHVRLFVGWMVVWLICSLVCRSVCTTKTLKWQKIYNSMLPSEHLYIFPLYSQCQNFPLIRCQANLVARHKNLSFEVIQIDAPRRCFGLMVCTMLWFDRNQFLSVCVCVCA